MALEEAISLIAKAAGVGSLGSLVYAIWKILQWVFQSLVTYFKNRSQTRAAAGKSQAEEDKIKAESAQIWTGNIGYVVDHLKAENLTLHKENEELRIKNEQLREENFKLKYPAK